MKTVVTLIVLVALATSLSAAEIDLSTSSSKLKVVNLSMIKDRVLGFAKQDPVNKNILWTGAGKIDISNNNFPGGSVANSKCVDFDKDGNGWFSCTDGLKFRNSDGSLKVYTVTDGLAATNCNYVQCDNDDNLLAVGTPSGLSISPLGNDGKPTGFSSPLSFTIHQIVKMKNGKKFVAVNTSRVFFSSNGKDWTTYDSSNSSITGNCHAAAFDVVGNLYVTISHMRNDFKVISSITKFDCTNNIWSKIDMSQISDTLININQIQVDCDNRLWCTFPNARASGPGNPVLGWLVAMDLTDGSIQKWAINGTGSIAYLDESACGGEPALNLTADGGIMIAANGVLVIGGNSSAVLPRLAVSTVERNIFSLVKTNRFNVLGQLIHKNTFSKPISGIYFFRTSDKSRTVGSLTAK
jgi:hypothetical protein